MFALDLLRLAAVWVFRLNKPKEKFQPIDAETDNSHRYLQSIIKRIGESKGAIVDVTTVAHNVYPEYFLGKFASQLI